MNDLRQNLWAVVVILVFLGACVAIGFAADNVWVPVIVVVGAVLCYWGTVEAIDDKPGQFLILTILGIGLVVWAAWMAQFAGRWWWAPVWLIAGLAPVVGASELRQSGYGSAGIIGMIIGLAAMALAIVGPLFLYKSLPELAFSLPFTLNLWLLWLILGLGSAWLAYRQADLWNPWRFSLLALAAVLLIGLATVSAGFPARWLWIIPWVVLAGLIGFGAQEIKRYSDGAGYFGYFLTLVSLAGAVVAALWYYGVLAVPVPAALAPEAVAVATQVPTVAPVATEIPPAATTPAIQPTSVAVKAPVETGGSNFDYLWQFLRLAVTSIWGIFHLLMIALIGSTWSRRWGAPLFLLATLVIVWFIGGTSPELKAAALTWISSSPVAWMVSIIQASIAKFDTPGIGILLSGLALVILLVPALRLLYRSGQVYQKAGALKDIIGTTAAVRYTELSDVSAARVLTGALVYLVVLLGLTVSLWIGLRQVANSGLYPQSKLGFLFIPDLTVPSFKPVWQWPYFALAGLTWLATLVSWAIQRRYTVRTQLLSCQSPLITLITSTLMAMFVPAGVVLFSLVQLVGQWVSIPLAHAGLAAKPLPGSPPRVYEPEPVVESPPVYVMPVEETPPSEPDLWEELTIDQTYEQVIVPSTPGKAEIQAVEIAVAPDAVASFAINELGQCLVLAKNGSMVLLEDGLTKAKTSLDLPEPLGLVSAARGEAAVISGDGKILAVVPAAGLIQVLREGKLSIPIQCYALNPFGTMLACAHPDTSRICGLFLGKMEERVFAEQIDNPTAIGFSRDGRYLGVGCEDGSVHILDIATRQETQVLTGSDHDLEGPVLLVQGGNRDGNPCWVVGYDNECLAQWTPYGELIESVDLSFAPNCLAVNPENGDIATGGKKGQVEVLSADLEVRYEDQVHTGRVLQLVFEKSTGKLYSVGSDQVINRLL
jgi:hypothetical protein